MVPQCKFTLPSGQKCRCAATRNQKFCRHHGPKACPSGPPVSKHESLSRIRRWSTLNRMIPWIDPAEIPFEAYSICEALLRDNSTSISDREAGRLLRALFRRLGAVPFSPPDEPGQALPTFPPRLAPPTQPPAGREETVLTQLLEKCGAGNIDEISDEDFLKAMQEIHGTRPSLTSTQPSLISTRPSSHQTRPSLNQTQPSLK